MQIYNSLTRKKETFQPIHEGKVGIYACGPTVYNYFHIGNARPFITFDVLRRYFEHRGYEVTFVQNFTDIDDKMIKRANAEGITVKELGDRFIKEGGKHSADLQQPNPKKAGLRSPASRQSGHLRLRPHGVRLFPHRQRPALHHVRRAAALL